MLQISNKPDSVLFALLLARLSFSTVMIRLDLLQDFTR